MKKAHIIQFSSLIMFLIVLIVFISNTMCYQTSSDEVRLKLFYNEKEQSMDVLLFGSSAVRAGFMPTKAYENYGIKSYNYGVNHMPLPAAKYLITEALQYQSPEVIVIDINGITYCSKDFTESKSAPLINSMREGENKENAVKELYGETITWEDEIPFIKYHKNIFRIQRCLKYKKYYEKYGGNASVLKGYTTNPVKVEDFSTAKIIDPNTITKIAKLTEYEIKTIEGLLDYCDNINDDVEIVFARFPRITIEGQNEWELEYINALEMEIVKRGYEYVDFYDYVEAFNIDLAKDFNDNTHLNVFGAEKFTNFLSEYLLEKYQMNLAENDEKWNKCVTYANTYYEMAKTATLKNEGKEYYEFDLANELKTYGV